MITSPNDFFGNDSSDDNNAPEDEAVQCCMISWADEWEKVNDNRANITQKVDQVTLQSGHQLQLLERVRKEKEKERTPGGPLILGHAKEKSEEGAIPSSSNSKGTAKNKESTKESRRNLPILVSFQVHQGHHKERARYDVTSHLKRILARLSLYDALQMSKGLRRALIQVLMDLEDYKDQVNPSKVDEMLSPLLNRCAACMACMKLVIARP